jgi:hypothetical protein
MRASVNGKNKTHVSDAEEINAGLVSIAFFLIVILQPMIN